MTPQRIVQAGINVATLAKSQLEEVDFGTIADYGAPDDLRAFGNWNRIGGYSDDDKRPRDLTPERVCKLLEQKGVDCEWSDEWTRCDNCYRFFRTSPDCYQWKQFGWFDFENCACYCGLCTQSDEDIRESYLAERIDNPGNAVNTDLVDLAAAGFKQLDEEYQNGWYGRNDKPPEILAALQQEFPDCEFVFTFEPSQFCIDFSAWKRPKSSDED